MRIGIVNDLTIAVESLRQALSSAPEHRIIWVARNGAEAVQLCNDDTPDIILMDLIMPVMDGVEATRRIMQSTPCAILIVTATVAGHSAKVFEAMGAGALDAVATPGLDKDSKTSGAGELLEKITRIGRLTGNAWSSQKAPQIAPSARPHKNKNCLVAIGCSTGGPKILVQILSVLPQNFPAAVVIVQHMDEKFTPGLIEWLDKQTALPVRIAAKGDRPQRGVVHLACTDNHLILTSANTFAYSREPVENFYHPSVDVFFNSVATNWQGGIIGVLLTGMGKDGAQGLLTLRQQGWHTIAQDKNTCIVYGMPKIAAEIGAAKEVLPADRIGSTLINLLMPGKNFLHGISANNA
ncbi:MAG: chemotaxis response regulator protein-glutamate methylesterase [Deltaproteobacteria bacterium RIFOXYD12_FULL_57_12]|nr:MAG: chemotaxis response regulator protein-glutamate methylesterase [Deltaproteobacteria bacterium RIFOXYD12_FULL_57_12]